MATLSLLGHAEALDQRWVTEQCFCPGIPAFEWEMPSVSSILYHHPLCQTPNARWAPGYTRSSHTHREAPRASQPCCPWGLGDTALPETLPSCTLNTQTEGNTETGAQVFPTPNSMLLPLCTLWNCRRFLKA